MNFSNFPAEKTPFLFCFFIYNRKWKSVEREIAIFHPKWGPKNEFSFKFSFVLIWNILAGLLSSRRENYKKKHEEKW